MNWTNPNDNLPTPFNVNITVKSLKINGTESKFETYEEEVLVDGVYNTVKKKHKVTYILIHFCASVDAKLETGAIYIESSTGTTYIATNPNTIVLYNEKVRSFELPSTLILTGRCFKKNY